MKPDGTVLASPVVPEVFPPFLSGINEFRLSSRITLFPYTTLFRSLVEVSHTGQGTGSYWLGISDPLQHFAPLSLTTPTQSAFGVRGDVQEWEFTGTASQAVGWTYQGVHAIKDWRITDASDPTATPIVTGSGGSLTT